VSRSYHHNKSGFRFSDDEISNAANEAYAERSARGGTNLAAKENRFAELLEEQKMSAASNQPIRCHAYGPYFIGCDGCSATGEYPLRTLARFGMRLQLDFGDFVSAGWIDDRQSTAVCHYHLAADCIHTHIVGIFTQRHPDERGLVRARAVGRGGCGDLSFQGRHDPNVDGVLHCGDRSLSRGSDRMSGRATLRRRIV
jgi:hypothetical protein